MPFGQSEFSSDADDFFFGQLLFSIAFQSGQFSCALHNRRQVAAGNSSVHQRAGISSRSFVAGVALGSPAPSIGEVCGWAGALATAAAFSRNGLNNSSGNGNSVVELFSAAISTTVCRKR